MTDRPFTSFVMFGAMRSGSNLLEKYLNQYEGLVCHGELFQKSFIGTQGCKRFLGIDIEARKQDPYRLLAAVRAADPDKITGFRLFQAHDPRIIEATLKDRHCAKIILTRDPVASYVSLQIALKTRQWLVSDIAHRKAARIRFDLEDYASYLEERSAFYRMIAETLDLSGQPYFKIDYTMLNDVENINRLAAFIGDLRPKTTLEQPIKRQNPGALADKIINIEEVRAALDAPILYETHPPVLTPVRERGTDLSRVYFGKNCGLAFGPQPAVPDLAMRNWLAYQGRKPPENGWSAHRYAEWRALYPDSAFLTVVRHPVKRAYTAFMNKIFASIAGGYIAIRQEMESRFGLLLPQGKIAPGQDRQELAQSGYSADQHRINFKLFLVFVAANLEDKTKIRQDGMWQRQSEILRRYRIIHPQPVVLKYESLQTDLLYLENLLDLLPCSQWSAEPEPAFSYPLEEIYDAEIESLARAAYGPDYQAFGYGDLRKTP